ncbi:unnamed protein product [Pseudo-nitzschia multistriata]|uniref:Uncharacterized protein n=1 Tax=Pseudo-nitzschia multistriata TaxID=183589 RepID=A0A448YWD3_9STRA|nr:unnamed protein product [Pseudo-nitzschia multistriata]
MNPRRCIRVPFCVPPRFRLSRTPTSGCRNPPQTKPWPSPAVATRILSACALSVAASAWWWWYGDRCVFARGSEDGGSSSSSSSRRGDRNRCHSVPIGSLPVADQKSIASARKWNAPWQKIAEHSASTSMVATTHCCSAEHRNDGKPKPKPKPKHRDPPSVGMSCDTFLPHNEMNAYLRETCDIEVAMARERMAIELPGRWR